MDRTREALREMAREDPELAARAAAAKAELEVGARTPEGVWIDMVSFLASCKIGVTRKLTRAEKYQGYIDLAGHKRQEQKAEEAARPHREPDGVATAV